MEIPPQDDEETLPSSGADTRVRSGERPTSLDRVLRHSEIVAAILLAIATVATAWCAYQATRWNGVQATAFAEASTDRSESNREFNFAIQLQSIDIELATLWMEAYRADDDERMAFYEDSLMRPELQGHLDEWVASDPALNPDDSAHPLASEQYTEDLISESERLQEEATANFQEAKDANQTGDQYVLATVIFASVLFFAGIAEKFSSLRVRGALIAFGSLMLIFGAVHIVSLPVH